MPVFMVLDRNIDRNQRILRALRGVLGQEEAIGSPSVFLVSPADSAGSNDLLPITNCRVVLLHERNDGSDRMAQKVRQEDRVLIRYSAGFVDPTFWAVSPTEVCVHADHLERYVADF